MKKNLNSSYRLFRALLTVFDFCLLLSGVGTAGADVNVDAGEYGSLSAAVGAIPADAGEVTISVPTGLAGAEDAVIMIPADRGITGLSIRMADDTGTFMPEGIERICACGIPLTIGAGIRLDNTSIYGGACVSGTEVSLDSSSLRIFGNAGFVFGGGLASDSGRSDVKDTSVIIEEGALIYYEVFGGGHAAGEGSRVFSGSASVVMKGTSDYVLGAGFAEDGGHSECTATAVTVTEQGAVPVALFGGGSAAGQGSLSSVDNTFTQLFGTAHWAFPGDFAFGGGETRLNLAGRLEILPDAEAVNAYVGGFSSDAGSKAFVNTAELMNCGNVELVIRRSQGTDGGEAKTQFTAVFPCDLPDSGQ